MPRMPTKSARMALANCAVVLASSTHLSFEQSCLSSGLVLCDNSGDRDGIVEIMLLAHLYFKERKIFSSIRTV